MPNLEQLFRERKNTSGPNTGKTAEEIYAPQDSKRIVPITSTNYAINQLNKSAPRQGLLGNIASGFDVLTTMNKLRNSRSVRLSETLNEEEQLGLKQFATTARPVIYGLDFPRITNQRTQTLLVMKKAAEQTVGGGLDDILGEAVGNYAGDAMANFLNNGKKATLPPKPDITPIALNAISDVGSRLLGAILPGPMIPSKVAEEFAKGYDKKKASYLNEFDIKAKIIDLKKADKVPGFFNNVLKGNANIMAQSKDFLISTASNLVRGLVKSGTSALLRGAVNLVSGKAIGKAIANVVLAGGSRRKVDQTLPYQLKYSSVTPYEKTILNSIRLGNPEYAKQPDMEGVYLRWVLSSLVNKGIITKATSYTEYIDKGYVDENELNNGTWNPQIEIERPYATPHYTMDGKVVDENTALANLLKPKLQYSNIRNTSFKDTLLIKRGMHTTSDLLNLSSDITYPGFDATNVENNTSFDDYDLIALKFYSYYKNETIQFRCTVSELSEQFTPSWEPNKFIGNPFNSYTYGGIERTVTFKFKVFSLNLVEHINAWRRLNVLAGLVYPQGYKGEVNAVAPPIIGFTLGDMYKTKTCFIENMTFTVDDNTPWEIGMNKKLIGAEIAPAGLRVKNLAGYNMALDKNLDGSKFKLPTIIDVDITLKFIESKASVYSSTSENNHTMYGYTVPTEQKA